MDIGLKQRLVGAAVLVSLAVIFVPMVLDGPGLGGGQITETNIPPAPEDRFGSQVVPLSEPERIRVETPATLPEPGVDPSLPLVGVGDGAARPAAPAPAESPAPAQPTAPKEDVRLGLAAWIVQVGSFSTADNANTLKDRLTKLGFNAFVEQGVSEDKKIFRVRIGPELKEETAKAILADVQSKAKVKGVVLRYP